MRRLHRHAVRGTSSTMDLEFNPSRYDHDVWMRLRDEKDGYDYIFIHVDDFKIVTKDADRKYHTPFW